MSSPGACDPTVRAASAGLPPAGSTDAGQAGAGSLAVRHAVHQLVSRSASVAGRSCRVLDVGGGSGAWAVPLAVTGCEVTVVETSPDALASLARRAREAGVSHLVTGVQGDADSLGEAVADGNADVVLAHGVLEVVEDVPATLRALVAAMAQGGTLSVLVAGRAAAVLHRALAGRIADAHRVLLDADGRVGPRDPLLRRFDVAGLEAVLTAAGLVVELVQGDAVVSDLVPSPLLETAPGAAAALAELELLASRTSPLREMASRLHAVASIADAVAPRPAGR